MDFYSLIKTLDKKFRSLAILFAVFTIFVAFFVIGTFAQVNAIVDSMQISFGVPIYITDIILTVLVGIIIFGGLKSISRATTAIVPFMAVLYFVNTDFSYDYGSIGGIILTVSLILFAFTTILG